MSEVPGDGQVAEKTAGPRTSVLLAVLLGLVVLVNLSLLGNGFLNWDDPELLTSNPRVQPHDATGLLRVLDPSDALQGRHLEWLPLRDAAYATMFLVGGLSPSLFHGVQLLFHLAVVLLLFWVTRRWVGERAALITAALFALHPVHVESVAWVAALKDPSFTATTLGCLLLYQRSVEATGWRRLALYLGSLGAMVAALGFKQIAVVIPALLLLVDLAFLRKRLLPSLLDKLPFGALTLAALLLFVQIGHANAVIQPPPGGTAFTGFLTMSWVFAAYLGKLIWPFALSARYVVLPAMTPADPRFLVAVVVVLALLGGALALRRRTPVPLFALGWITVGLLPVMNIVPIPIEMADRYLYLPSIGFAVAVAVGMDRLLSHSRQAIVSAAAALSLGTGIVWTGQTAVQNQIWEDDISLWRSVVEREPDLYVARTNLASALLARNEHQEAEKHLRAVLLQRPDHHTALLNLGYVLRTTGRLDEARTVLERAIAIKPDYAKAYTTLAAVLMDQKRYAEARPILERALQADPEHPTSLRNLAVVCMQLEDQPCALASMRRAIDARPADRALFLTWLDLLRATSRAGDAALFLERAERFFAADREVWGRIAILAKLSGDSKLEADAAARAGLRRVAP